MTKIDWYPVINRADFLATGLVSRELSLNLEGAGTKTFLVTVGNLFSLTVDGVMLSLGVTQANPFVFEEHAIFVDPDDLVWYGIVE